MTVLVVEDEKNLSDVICQIMKDNKFKCDAVYNGIDGFEYASSGIYDVVVLDIMLPKMDGFEVVRRLRREKIEVPILLLTARDSLGDKVKGLDYGADDYLTKPFEKEELLARIRALTRRKGQVMVNELSFEDITLGLSTCILSKGEKSVKLGYKEFEIMKLLMANPKNIVQKEELLTKVWGYDSDAEDNNVEVYICFLRRKLEFLKSKITISTVRKIGYHLEITEKA
jgi:DNA-binding response OmpR family regulator